MQNRYVGDIGDYGKIGLLRQICRSGLSVGMNWYLTPDESHNNDGRHVAYLQNRSYASCDKDLWEQLGKIVASDNRHIKGLENSQILPAAYYSAVLDFADTPKAERTLLRWQWHTAAMDKLRDCDVIFADPDNGLIVPSAEGGPKSNKYVLPMELAEYYRAGKSVIYYQHKARLPDSFYVAQNDALVSSGAFPEVKTMGLKFRPFSVRYYFFLMQPHHANMLTACAERMLGGPWAKCFERV